MTMGSNAPDAPWRLETVPTTEDGARLDRFMRRLVPGMGQGQIERLLRNGVIRLDGAKAKSSTRLVAGQVLRLPKHLASTDPATKKPLTVSRADAARQIDDMMLAEGRDWLALAKPSGLAVQGGTGTSRHIDGLLQALAADPATRLRLVHRIDKDTSGILLLAKSVPAARDLTAAFQRHRIKKTYLALVNGLPDEAGRIDAPLRKMAGAKGDRMQVDTTGQSATTLYKQLDHAGRKVALMALRPLTGRTHQLRIHMAHNGTPICGDGKYGGEAAHPGGMFARRLHLHAWQLALPDGAEIVAPPDGHMKASLDALGMAVPAQDWRFDES